MLDPDPVIEAVVRDLLNRRPVLRVRRMPDGPEKDLYPLHGGSGAPDCRPIADWLAEGADVEVVILYGQHHR